MKREMKIIAIIGIFVVIGTTQIAHVHCNSEFKELIDVLIASDGTSLNTEVNFYFDMSSIPINISLPAFDLQHFNYAEYYTTRYGNGDRYMIDLICSFSKETNETMANEALQEFLRAFNHGSLSILTQENSNNVTFRYRLGYISNNLDSMRNFFKYKPSGPGFSNLVDKFLQLYVPGNTTTGIVGHYTLSKSGIGYKWEVWIQESSKFGTFTSGKRTIDLNHLINNNGESLISCEYKSAVVVRLRENLTIDSKTYSIKIKSMSPQPDYNYVQDNDRRLIWELEPNEELQDVVVEINLISNDDPKPFFIETAIVFIVLLVIAVSLVYRRYSKQKYRGIIKGPKG